MRVAVIDLGTVTCRLGLARVEDGKLVEFSKSSEIVNFGEGVAQSSRILEDAFSRTLECISGYVMRAKEAGAQAISFVLTSASRDASNMSAFLAACKDLGLVPQVISGEVEGELTFVGAAQNFLGEHIVVADNGGGSTELSEGKLDENSLELSWVYSANVGCRRVSDLYLYEQGPASAELLKEAHEFCAARFYEALQTRRSTAPLPSRLVVTGGTATSLVAIARELEPYDSKLVHLSELSLGKLQELEEMMAARSVEERAALKGLQAKRAPVILAGTVALVELVRALGTHSMCVSESDLLQGLCLRTYEAAHEIKSERWLPHIATSLR